MHPSTYARVVTIAGSDSGGGAGIQADLKTIAAHGCYGASIITALTAQNTLGVTAIHPVPTDFVAAQMDAVFGDIGADAVKIGMLFLRNSSTPWLRACNATTSTTLLWTRLWLPKAETGLCRTRPLLP